MRPTELEKFAKYLNYQPKTNNRRWRSQQALTLTTGVDARNVRNIVLLRPGNSMIEFKQIIGRGTRLFEGKHYFTIVDFVNAYHLFLHDKVDTDAL